MTFFDKEKVKSNFNNFAKKYNENAILQDLIAEKLVKLAKKDLNNAKNIIDLGSGSGFISKENSFSQNY